MADAAVASPTAIVQEDENNIAATRAVKFLPCARSTFVAPTSLSLASIYAQFLESEAQRWLQTKGENFQLQQLPLPLREEINRLSLLTSHFKSRSTSSSSSPVATSEDMLFASPSSSSMPLISVIMPVHNSMPYLVATIFSVMYQTYRTLEICIYDDFSRDDSRSTLELLRSLLLNEAGQIELKIDSAEKRGFDSAKGAGFARNRAMELAKGEFFAFQDSDDLSLPLRFEKQYYQFLKEKETLSAQQQQPQQPKTDSVNTDAVQSPTTNHPLILLGCHLERLPLDSTPRWTRWINSLTDSTQLFNHAFREITLPCPTWFTSRYTFEKVGNFQEVLGEDMHFFYKSFLASSGTLSTIPSTDNDTSEATTSSSSHAGPLLVYRNHASNLSGRTPFSYLFGLRVSALESMVLRGTRFPAFSANQSFTIWNAGKAGKHLYRGLSPETRARVKAFCDIDPKKIGRGVFEDFDDATRRVLRKIPIISWEHATAPAIICVRQEVEEDESQREFRHRIEVVKGWKEGIDYFFLS